MAGRATWRTAGPVAFQLVVCAVVLAHITDLSRASATSAVISASGAVPPPQRIGGYAPPGTSASAWTRNVVLCYMDSRSFSNSSGYNAEFDWTVGDKFEYLLAWRDTHALPPAQDAAAGALPPARDTFFDGFLLIGMEWFGGKNFWQGQGTCCTNSSDWMGFLALQVQQGVQRLEAASKSVAAELGMGATGNNGMTPGVIMMIPYPDTRQGDFGAITPGGHSLNFTASQADRTAAMIWYVDQALAAWEAVSPQHIRNVGFYHFLESLESDGDADMLAAVGAHIHAQGALLRWWWVPYFGSRGYPQWRSLGFDVVTLQPNYAFHNSSAAERFADVANLTTSLGMGVEMELPQYTRNPQVKDWQTSFVQYLNASVAYGFDTMAMRTYYLGNAFVTMATNASTTCFYDRLFWSVKGTYPYATPLPNVTWPTSPSECDV